MSYLLTVVATVTFSFSFHGRRLSVRCLLVMSSSWVQLVYQVSEKMILHIFFLELERVKIRLSSANMRQTGKFTVGSVQDTKERLFITLKLSADISSVTDYRLPPPVLTSFVSLRDQ